MKIVCEPFGKTSSGSEVYRYTMCNDHGVSIVVLNLGGIVFELNVPDRQGCIGNISANLETVEDYMTRSPHFGTLVGRFANRIAKATFTLDGREYRFEPNNGENLLHGGKNGFRYVLFDIEECTETDRVSLRLHHYSPESEQGFPGNLDCTIVYTLDNENVFEIDYTATTDKPTPVNLTNHTYFNLSAFDGQTIDDVTLFIDADHYIPVNKTLIPTGEIAPVNGTPMDFREPRTIGSRLAESGGYDHCYVLNRAEINSSRPSAVATDPRSGRRMEMWTTAPGVQFYSGNFLNGSLHAFGRWYGKHSAFCLETEHFPDSPNQPGFPNTILLPGETYRHTTRFRFTTEG